MVVVVVVAGEAAAALQAAPVAVAQGVAAARLHVLVPAAAHRALEAVAVAVAVARPAVAAARPGVEPKLSRS